MFQTMLDPQAVSGQAPPAANYPLVKVTGPLGDTVEGTQAMFAIQRVNNVPGDVSVTWTATAPSGDTTGPLTGTITLPTGRDHFGLVIPTINRAGLQAEPRQISIVLSNAVGGDIDPAGASLDIPIRNRVATLPTWYNLPIRSGRAWAGGTAYLTGTLAVDPNAQLEQVVAYNDAGLGHSRGNANSRVATWDQVIGGALGGPLLASATQFQWDESSSFGLHFLRFPNSAGWLLWDMSLIPTSRATNGGDASVWTEIANGGRDAEMQAIGARIASAFATKGHNLNRFIGIPHLGANAGGYFQVFETSRMAYKAAMERAMAQIRSGAGYALKFAHCPATTPWIGNLTNWTPANVDAIGLDYNPGNAIVDAQSLADLLDNTGFNLHYSLRTDLLDTADTLNVPIVVPRWAVHHEAGNGCPYSLEAINRFHADFLQSNAARIVCECLSDTTILNASGYLDGQAGAAAVWGNASASFKTKWHGANLGDVVPYTPPTVSVSARVASVSEGDT